MIRRVIRFSPTLFILFFVVIYIISTFFYAGGSQQDYHSIGFNWIHNYWCDLLNEYSYDGSMINPSRPIAIVGMFFLSASLISLFILFPQYYPLSKKWNLLIQISGVLCMCFAFFVFTKLHDIVTILSSILGIFPLIGVYYALFKHKKRHVFSIGILAIILLGANNLVYYTGMGIYYLPLLQKISFLFILCWFVIINVSFKTKQIL